MVIREDGRKVPLHVFPMLEYGWEIQRLGTIKEGAKRTRRSLHHSSSDPVRMP